MKALHAPSQDYKITPQPTYRLASRPRSDIACLIVSNHVEQHALAFHQPGSPSSWISAPVLPSQIALAHPSPLSVLPTSVLALLRVWHRRDPQVLLVQGPVGRGHGGHEQHRAEPHGATMWSRRLGLHGATGRHLGRVSGVKAATWHMCSKQAYPSLNRHSQGPDWALPDKLIGLKHYFRR